ncbi:MAG TPA: polyprenyl synthetase family protein [Candidatus Polarisedimenticolaceae bacterium]|nr:polyprenyl synthetase family protein [Candidatus Polarisedimenticolaceae bacterium]
MPRVDDAARVLSGPASTKSEIGRLVGPELIEVERVFRDSLASPLSIVDEIGSFIAEGGGKRIRPTLHLLSTKLCGYDGPHAVLMATVLEFIHSATLIHDDIIDQATTRRGLQSVNSRWGNDVTVLFGDYLFAKAMQLALRAESIPIMDRLAEVTLSMTEGEMLQTRYAGRLDLSVDEYLDLVQRKTAGLFSCCCDLAAMLAGVGPDRQSALHGFGSELGMAFQIVDDLLDLTGDSRTMGKPAASDLREGKATLAVIELLRSGGREAAEGRELAERLMGDGPALEPSAVARLTELLAETGAIDRARGRAERHARSAASCLDIFDDSPARRALGVLPELVLTRDR